MDDTNGKSDVSGRSWQRSGSVDQVHLPGPMRRPSFMQGSVTFAEGEKLTTIQELSSRSNSESYEQTNRSHLQMDDMQYKSQSSPSPPNTRSPMCDEYQRPVSNSFNRILRYSPTLPPAN